MRRISTLHSLGLMALESEEVKPVSDVPAVAENAPAEDGEVDPNAEVPADDLHPEDPPVEPIAPVEGETPADPEVPAEPATPAAPAEGEPEVPAEPAAEVPAGDTPAEEVPAGETPADPAAPAEGEVAAELPAEDPVDQPADIPAEVVPVEGESVIPAAAIAEPAPETDPANPTAPVDEAPAAPAEGEVAAAPAEGETPAAPVEGDTPAEDTEGVPAEVPETGEHAPAEPADEEHDTASLDADLASIEASKEQGEDNDAEQDDAVEVKEALESFADIVYGACQHNGMDTHGAALLDTMTSRLYKQVGFSATKQSSVSLESFDPATSTIAERRKASLEALQDIKDKVSTIWKAIVAALKRAVEWVKGHFKKIFDAAVLVERAANMMVARAAKTKDVEHKTEGLTDSRLATALSIGGKPSKDLRGDVSHLAGMVDIVLGDMQKDAQSIGEKIVYGIEKMSDEYTNDVQKLGKRYEGFQDAPGFTAPEGIKVARSKEMLGGKAIVQMYPENIESIKEHISSCSITLRDYEQKEAGPDTETKAITPWLTPGETGQVAQAVADMAKTVRYFRKNLDGMVALQERCAKAASVFTVASKESHNEEQEARMRERARFAMHLPKLVSEPFTSFSHYVLVTSRNLLELGNLSLKGS